MLEIIFLVHQSKPNAIVTAALLIVTKAKATVTVGLPAVTKAKATVTIGLPIVTKANATLTIALPKGRNATVTSPGVAPYSGLAVNVGVMHRVMIEPTKADVMKEDAVIKL